jgi:hypothetical protein
MKTKSCLSNLEKGQILPIVVLSLFALIAMAALLIDGGMLMSHRRTAQAAADAGAMAGATHLCPNTYDINLAISTATQYVSNNNAGIANPPTVSGNSILVETIVESSSFFARIFNQMALTAQAEAEASCLILGSASDRVLPVVFPCIPDDFFNEFGDDYSFTLDEQGTCASKFYDGFGIPTDEEYSELVLNGYITIIMDTDDDTAYCKPEGPFECDVDGDGRNEIVAAGSRGWLSLDGTSNPTNLKKWITDGFDGTIYTGYWLSTITGVDNSMFDTVKSIEGDQVTVPLFNSFCRLGKPSEIPCSGWQEGDNDDYVRTGVGVTSYRINAFGKFVVTCVHSTGQDVTNDKGVKGSRCGFRDWLIKTDPYNVDSGPNLKSIEGYYIEMVEGIGISGGDPAGTYIVQLTK